MKKINKRFLLLGLVVILLISLSSSVFAESVIHKNFILYDFTVNDPYYIVNQDASSENNQRYYTSDSRLRTEQGINEADLLDIDSTQDFEYLHQQYAFDFANNSWNNETSYYDGNYDFNDTYDNLDSGLYLGNPWNFDNYSTGSEGYYYATYSFENEIENTDLEISYVDQLSNGIVSIVDEVDAHKEVMNCTATTGTINVQDDDIEPQTAGTVELWVYLEEDITISFNLRQGSSTKIIVGYKASQNKAYWYDGVSNTNGILMNLQTWYHFKIEFDCMTDLFNFWVNGYLQANNADFYSTADSISRTSFEAMVGQTLYVDAIGYSWDSDYEISNNLNAYGQEVINDLDNTPVFDYNIYYNTSIGFLDGVSGRNSVLVLNDTSSTFQPELYIDLPELFTICTREIFECKFMKTTTSIMYPFGFYSSDDTKAFEINIDDNINDGTGTIAINTWYQIQIIIENDYDYSIYLNEASCKSGSFDSNVDIDYVKLTTATTTEGAFMCDSFGYTLDDNFYSSEAYTTINYTNDDSLKYVQGYTTSSINRVSELDGHKNVLKIDDNAGSPSLSSGVYYESSENLTGLEGWFYISDSSNIFNIGFYEYNERVDCFATAPYFFNYVFGIYVNNAYIKNLKSSTTICEIDPLTWYYFVLEANLETETFRFGIYTNIIQGFTWYDDNEFYSSIDYNITQAVIYSPSSQTLEFYIDALSFSDNVISDYEGKNEIIVDGAFIYYNSRIQDGVGYYFVRLMIDKNKIKIFLGYQPLYVVVSLFEYDLNLDDDLENLEYHIDIFKDSSDYFNFRIRLYVNNDLNFYEYTALATTPTTGFVDFYADFYKITYYYDASGIPYGDIDGVGVGCNLYNYNDYNYNDMKGFRIVYDNINSYEAFIDFPLFSEIIKLGIPNLVPSGSYWEYASVGITTISYESLEVGENATLSFSFPILGATTEKAYYQLFWIETRNMPNWGVFGEWNWLRDGLFFLLNWIFLMPFNAIVYCAILAINFIVMYLILGVVAVSFWNYVVKYILLGGMWLLYAIYLLVYTIIPQFLSWFLTIAMPIFLDIIALLISIVLGTFVWWLTLGLADLDLIINTIDTILSQMFDFFYSILFWFITNLFIILLYVSSYILILYLLYGKYLYVKSKGWSNRQEQIANSYKTLSQPVQWIINACGIPKKIIPII